MRTAVTPGRLLDTVTEAPLHQALLEIAAEKICNDFSAALPDLGNIHVLLPSLLPATRFREYLLKAAQVKGFNALLGPQIETLPAFLQNYAPISSRTLISREHRLLLLVDALRDYPKLYGSGSPWLLAENLLSLFDELTLQRSILPNTEASFIEQMAQSYGLQEANHALLVKEAKLVYTLWRAWHEQLDAEGYCDQIAATVNQLGQSLTTVPANHAFYFIGFNRFKAIEQDWVARLIATRAVNILFYGKTGKTNISPHTKNSSTDILESAPKHSHFYHACFDYEAAPFYKRIAHIKNKYPQSPIIERLKTLTLASHEQQAQAISIKVRHSLLKGKKNIGIITENRQLARRVRALLERYDIAIQDRAGWALSTTSAATVIENWLRCLEEDFPYQAFLDLLKSSYVDLGIEHSAFLKTVYRFEQDIVLHENIASGLQRYQQKLISRSKRLQRYSPQTIIEIQTILQHFEKAARVFKNLVTDDPHDAHFILSALIESLQALGISQTLQTDEAGKLILHALHEMQNIPTEHHYKISWTDFRIWLGRMLETHYFVASHQQSEVTLVNLQQGHLLKFDTVILASAEKNQLPGNPASSPFFNEAVRASLNLPAWYEYASESYYLFRILLEQCDDIIVTRLTEENGQPVAANPWIIAIENFHLSCYNANLIDEDIKQFLDHELSLQHVSATAHEVTQPRPAINADLLPEKISVSGHQRLINCPYQFFVADILKLTPTDEIRETLQKSDYGNRIHRCLEIFHQGSDDIPAFNALITESNKAQAISYLEKISATLFQQDIEDNFIHRGWLQRWVKVVPLYIDWQIQRQQEWAFSSAEKISEINITDNIRLYGRIDRIDNSVNGLGLIDYKTGSFASKKEVSSGEDIQLSSYGLLVENAARVEYLNLDNKDKINGTAIDGDELDELTEKIQQRLKTLIKQISEEQTLPAWPYKETCKKCNAAGICRHQVWNKK